LGEVDSFTESLALNVVAIADMDVPFRYGGSLSSGRQESSRLRFNALLVGTMVFILDGERPFGWRANSLFNLSN